MLQKFLLLCFFASVVSAEGYLGTEEKTYFDEHVLDQVLYDFYMNTKGPTNWPPPYRTRWGTMHSCAWDGRENVNPAPFGTRCVNGGWNTLATCGGLMYFDHLSGMAEGPMPEMLKAAKKLSRICLHGNKLNGNIWNTSFHVFMHTLDISSNRFTGSLGDDFMQRNTHSETINVGKNQFSGTLPRSLSYLTNTVALLMNDNQFEGTIPNLGALTKLSHLRLNNNRLSGTIGDWMSTMSRLAWVELDDNPDLSGPFPPLPPSVSRFTASGTKLSGMLPASYGTLPKLRHFLCKGCDVQCPTPDFFAHLQVSTHCRPAGSRLWE